MHGLAAHVLQRAAHNLIGIHDQQPCPEALIIGEFGAGRTGAKRQHVDIVRFQLRRERFGEQQIIAF